MIKENEAKGIAQTDLILRSALVEAIADLRARPWLLETVFAGLKQDELTKNLYGEKEIARAIRWFNSTDIPVVMSYALRAETIPAISIELNESSEVENTLADVHFQTSQPQEADWPPLTDKFAPQYDPSTGTVTLPQSISDVFVCTIGMVLVDRNGDKHRILKIIDRQHFVIDTALIIDFSGSYIKSSYPRLIETLESANFREGYRLGCTVHGDPLLVHYLHSILSFCLLHYRQDLLEARGIERTAISSGPVVLDQRFNKENVFSRFISLSGFVKNVWPKRRLDRVQWVEGTLDVSKVNEIPLEFVGEQAVDPAFYVQRGAGLPRIPPRKPYVDEDD
jgi:hypothetical protein